MKKVALINPGKNNKYAITEPLNLGFIASYLEKNNIKVTIIDEMVGQDVKKEIEKFSPDIVGVTATTPFAFEAYRVTEMCRKMGILTVIGGVHVSILPDEGIKHADIVVKGEGEIAMMDIIKENIRSGIISRPYIENIEDVPSPARHLMDMDFYSSAKDRFPNSFMLKFVPLHVKTASMLTSRGCPFSCTFCHNSWRGIPWRFNSPERVISEIEDLVNNYGIKAIFFIEDNFFANNIRVKKICELIDKKGIDIIWGANARVNGVDLEILQIAKKSGCREVIFGFESGSQRILDILNKKTTVEQNKKAIELCNQAGIIPAGTVMIGSPTETIEDIRNTQKFLRDSNIRDFGVSITTPFPGTEIWNECEKKNLIPASLKWSDFTFDKVVIPVCGSLSSEEIQRLFEETVDIGSEKNFNSADFIKESLVHPKMALMRIFHIFKNPKRAIKYIKKIKI